MSAEPSGELGPESRPMNGLAVGDSAPLASAGSLLSAQARAAALEALAVRADAHAEAARSPRTRDAYAGDWERFTSWCALAGLAPLPTTASTLRLYLTDLEAARDETGAALFAPATMARRLAAIAAAHRDAGHPSPTRDPAVTAVLTGIRRARAHPTHRMRPLLLEDLRTVLAGLSFGSWPDGVTAARDAFVLLAGFAGALRRSELAALRVEDLTFHPADGLHLRIRSSKTDQDALGATVALPYGTHPGTCPPCVALRWLRLLDADRDGRAAVMRAVLATPPFTEQTHLYPHPQPAGTSTSNSTNPGGGDSAAARTEDARSDAHAGNARVQVPDLPDGAAVLRGTRKGGRLLEHPVTGDALHAMVQRRAADAGLPGPVGFHSLRAGFVTQARRGGAEHRAVRRQTRHSSDAMVELYDRDHTPLAGNAVNTLGL